MLVLIAGCWLPVEIMTGLPLMMVMFGDEESPLVGFQRAVWSSSCHWEVDGARGGPGRHSAVTSATAVLELVSSTIGSPST
ncbi:hypothetical protein [Streptomyces sp. NPDC006739]|uniref:hypothetical protein n=1 Tax=Streptomyces sp. NPDC006739 TaxID=3364763 RepID=UPI0036AEF24B